MERIRSANKRSIQSRARPKVAHVTEALGGGVQTAIQQYIANSPHADHVLIARTRTDSKVVDEKGVVQAVLTANAGDGFAKFAKNALKALKAVDATHVHLHSSFAGQLRHVLNPANYEIIYSPHCFAFERCDINAVQRSSYKMLERIASSRYPHVIAGVSDYERRTASAMSRKVEAVELPNVFGEHNAEVCALLATRIQNPPRRIATVGRVGRQKAPEYCAEAARLLDDQGIEWVWVGDGAPKEVARLRSAGVRVTGWQPRTEAFRVLSESGLYVHTAAWEGAPMASLEARANGVPVLMRRTRTTAGLPFQHFGGVNECVAAIRDFFEDQQNREKMIDREIDYINHLKESKTNQAAVLNRLYAI
ncbi:glycosyltransferase family 4 protein [Gordonia sp. UBA7860]|uniref:glycosyltransferase family 4 protein n=1 Tax=Gordonia sp. UBA7860 TaxID=1946579 RepID=UPI00257F4CE6|nr:glycosyltransferase family 4 protein [Gordonia sp. UBA7860]